MQSPCSDEKGSCRPAIAKGMGLCRLASGVLGALRGRRVVEGRENGDGTVTISKADFDLLRLKDHAFDNVKEVRIGSWPCWHALFPHQLVALLACAISACDVCGTSKQTQAQCTGVHDKPCICRLEICLVLGHHVQRCRVKGVRTL